jgi:hypothetical protein
MARFEDIGGGRVLDNVTGYAWEQNVMSPCSWNDLPEGILVPTLAEMKTLIDGQKAAPEDFAAAFGEGNAPVGWYWVYSIDPALENVWQATYSQTNEAAEALSLKKPGHVAAWFNWQGNQPCNRRILQAFFRPIQRPL